MAPTDRQIRKFLAHCATLQAPTIHPSAFATEAEAQELLDAARQRYPKTFALIDARTKGKKR